MKYAKIINEKTISQTPPRSATINGCLVTGELPREYLATLDFYPLVETDIPQEEPDEGYHWAKGYVYDDNESSIVQLWLQEKDSPPSPRVFSRLYLEIAIARLGIIDQFDALLKSIEIEPGYTAYRAFERANEISESFPNFNQYVASIKTALGLTDEDVEEVLSSSVMQ